MGMDVYGKMPTSESGSYFRNNVWYWHPLWDYCLSNHGDITGKVENGHSNDGDGLDADDAHLLGKRLFDDLSSGRVAAYKAEYDYQMSTLPMEDCKWCETTGIRSDEIGVEMGWANKELDEAEAIMLGRTHGSCNACHGLGKTPHFATNYPFEVDNVREFAEFLLDCGGFEIC